MALKKKLYYSAPVETVLVTHKNMEEVAEWCGGVISEAESRVKPGRMDKYVWVPTPKGSQLSWAFAGMYVTRRIVQKSRDEISVTWAVFRGDYFKRNYFVDPYHGANATWGKHDPTVIEEANAQERTKKAADDVIDNAMTVNDLQKVFFSKANG